MSGINSIGVSGATTDDDNSLTSAAILSGILAELKLHTLIMQEAFGTDFNIEDLEN